jgi:hypothetical protein
VSGSSAEPQDQIARLEARIAALESALLRRSEELRLLQRHICVPDLMLLSRILEGLPPSRGVYDPALWRETIEVTEADVEPTLQDLWVAVAPRPDTHHG